MNIIIAYNKALDIFIDICENCNESKANDALASAQTYADNLNTSMGNRVTVIENALTWQVIPASQN